MSERCCASTNRKARIVPGLLGISLAACLMMAPASVHAQSDRDTANRIERMENEIQTLSRAVYKGEQPPAGAFSGGSSGAADVELRLQQMESDVRELRGQVEQQSHETRQLREQLERMTGDVELRLNELEGKRGAGSSASGRVDSGRPGAAAQSGAYEGESGAASSPPDSGDDGYRWGTDGTSRDGGGKASPAASSSSDAGDTLASPSADEAAAAYENAFAMIKAANYDSAQSGFEDFLKRYPNHVLAGNAKYWLGEAYYAKGKYSDAARIFAEGYKQYPKGSKAADNLLKLGLSLEALGKKSDACVALKQLQKENMAGAAPVIRRAEQEMARIGC